jgi:Lon protease-like protein
LLRIFPLANVVLFPGTQVPLHVFEPRYRQLTAAALDDDRLIGMVALRPQNVDERAGDPPIFQVGCAGVITQAQNLPDGRYNVVLRGSHRFRLVDEPPRPPEQLFRTVEAIRLEDPSAAREKTGALRVKVAELLRILASEAEQARSEESLGGALARADDTAFTNAVCQYLELPVTEKQALLEASGVLARLERLFELLQFRVAERATAQRGGSDSVH